MESNQQLKKVVFVSDRMLYTEPRDSRWDIALSVHAPTENKSNDKKDSFYDELEGEKIFSN